MSVFNIFKGGKAPKLTEEEIEKEIAEIKKQIQGERKAIEDLKKLVDMYERARDEQGKKMTESKIQEINKNIDNLKKKKEQLKQQLPPRPLPQPVFVQVSSARASVAPTALKPKPPPVLKVDDLVIKQPPALIVPTFEENTSENKPLIEKTEPEVTQPPSKPTTGPLAEKAKAIWSFESRHPDELSVKENESITILQRHGYTPQETEWCLVRNSSGKVGYLPTNYLESENNGEEKKLKPGVLFQVVSIHDYSASKEDELSFTVDEVIDVLKTEFPGWWLGVLNEKTGLFPSNFVKKLGANEPEIEEQATQKFPFSAVGLFDYQAQFEDELTFKEGQPIQILSKEMNGWYKGKMTLPNNTEKIGLVAANFIKQVEQKTNVQEKAQFLNKEIDPKNNNYNMHSKGQYAPPPANPKPPANQSVGKSTSVTKPPPPRDEREPLISKGNESEVKKGCCTIV